MRCNCPKMANNRTWMICTSCQGRIHHTNCTSKLDKRRDCCKARHQMLHDQGQVRGIADASQAMLEGMEYLK